MGYYHPRVIPLVKKHPFKIITADYRPTMAQSVLTCFHEAHKPHGVSHTSSPNFAKEPPNSSDFLPPLAAFATLVKITD
jgi:hypothetical protein